MNSYLNIIRQWRLAQTLPAFLSYAKKAHGIAHYRVSIFRRHSVGVTPNFCLKHLLK